MEITTSDLTDALNGREGLFTFLRDKLDWPLDPEDTYTYNESDVAGRAAARADVSRLLPFSVEDPFVLFLIEFKNGFRRTDLREILRGVRRNIRERAAYNNAPLESLVFVCVTEEYSGLRFVHFEETEGRQARMRVFGFDAASVGETYTLRRENLSKLQLARTPEDTPDWNVCKEDWLKAWNVEAVTEDFFRKYAEVFQRAENALEGFGPKEGRERRLFTQRLFNRLLFIHFLSKRGWLTFPVNGTARTDYLFALWDGRDTKENFYLAHLIPLFFAGLNNPQSQNLVRDNPALYARIGSVPFLNGGLFEQTAEEKARAVTIPDAVFADIFQNLFACYNFTITESTPDDQEVAVDPEMLGKVFERLVTGDDRQAKGAFYTPRSVVQFMCKEALKGYLTRALPITEKPGAIERLIDERDDTAVTVAEARVLLSALALARVVDPACGSGAYLLGMMQTIFDLMRLLDTRAATLQERDNYDRKLSIIQQNLYGVDVEAFAVNIAMLRLWLSLIVDYRDADAAKLPPLPNLEFKIEVGDSLSAPDPRLQGDIFRSALLRDADELARLKFAHFHETGSRKTALSDEIHAREAQIADDLKKNAAVNVALPENAFDWRVRFIEVFSPLPLAPSPSEGRGGTGEKKGVGAGLAPALPGIPASVPPLPSEGEGARGRGLSGFHIVIANPPYGGEPVSEGLRDRYFPRYKPGKKTNGGNGGNGNGANGNGTDDGAMSKDLYGIFMARALELLTPGGQFCFIVSNTWRTIKSFRPLRKRLLERATVSHVLDLPNWIFEATVNTGIVTLTNAAPPPGHRLIAGDLTGIARGDWSTLEANLRLIAARGVDVQTPMYARYTYPQALIGTYDNLSFFIASPRLYALMSDARFTKLGDIAQVKVGLQASDNEYYLRKREGVRGSYRLLNESELLTNAEIAALTDEEKRDGVDPAKYEGRFIVPYDKGGESQAGEGWLPNYYVPTGYFFDWSAAAVHRLETYTSDSQNGRVAARFQNKAYYFRKGVTFSPTGIYSPTFRLGTGAIFGNKGSTIFSERITPELLLACAANIAARYLLKSYASHTVETGEEVIGQLPLPVITGDAAERLEILVATIVEKQKANPRYSYHLHEQREIDALVYELYRLGDDDIREVVLWYCRRYPALAAAQGVFTEATTQYASYLERAQRLLDKEPSYWRAHPLLARIAEDEGPFLDFKECLAVDYQGVPERHPGKHVAKAVAAFLNTGGGTVLIGVADNGRIVGLERDLRHVNHKSEDGFQQKLRQILEANLSPAPRGAVEVSFAPLPEGVVCVIEVTPALGVTYFEDKVHVRDGNRTAELTGRDLVEWVARRSGAKANNSAV